MEGRLRLVSEGGFVVAFNGCEQLAVFVFQAFDDFRVSEHVDFLAVFASTKHFVQAPLDFDAHAGCGFDQAAALAVRAVVKYGAFHAFVFALACHFEQTQGRDRVDFGAGAVFFKQVFEGVENGLLVFFRAHINQVEDDQPADVAQAQLPGDFADGFEVGRQDSLRLVFAAVAFAGVDVNGDHRFRLVNADIASAGQRHFAIEDAVDLVDEVMLCKDRGWILVEFDLGLVLEIITRDQFTGAVVHFLGVDDHFVHVFSQAVAECAFAQVGFLVDADWGSALSRDFAFAPVVQEQVEVTLEVLEFAASADRAADQPHVRRQFQAADHFAEAVALFALFDALGDADVVRIGQEH